MTDRAEPGLRERIAALRPWPDGERLIQSLERLADRTLAAPLPDEELAATKQELLAEVLRRCMGIGADDNARHDFGDMNGGSLQRPTEVAAELLRALSDEGLTIANAAALRAERAAPLDVERLARAMEPVTRALYGKDDIQTWRQKTAEKIAAEYAALAPATGEGAETE